MNDVRAAFFVIRYMKTVIRYIGRAKVFTKKCGMVLSDYRQESKYAVPIKIKRKGKPQEEESMRNAKVKKSNKILAAITAAMLAVTIGGTGVTAFANNNSDTYECFSFSGENTLRSDFRRKDDTSSSWCNCYDSSNSDSGFYIQVYGTSEHNNTSGSYCGRRSYYFSEDTTWYMWNVVYETYGDCDYTAAYLIASPQGSIYDDFECWWSPDNGSGITGDENL